MTFFAKDQIRVIALNDPIFLFKAAMKLLKNPNAILSLLRGNTEKLPVDFYEIGESLLATYIQIVYKKKYKNVDGFEKPILKRILDENYGSEFNQRVFVKWNATLHLITMLKKPNNIVETGVFWGYSSAQILNAMNNNDEGFLYSIVFSRPQTKIGRFRTWFRYS